MEAARVAEVLRDGGAHRSGSGYLVATGKVLTAWHVVRRASSPHVRLAGSLLPATVAFSDAARDLAILDVAGTHAVPPVRPGFPAGDFVPASVAGYPWWKRRPDGSYALAHEQASIAALANDHERTLQLTVAPPAAHPDPDSSPWQGISGGPVFAAGRLVGVLARHHSREGLNRLTATRVDASPELLRLLGSARPPSRNHHLREFTPVGGLLDRDAELAAMAAFCAGPNTYLWWQAGPWAGKSALMAAFALDPPPDTEVVPYFIRAAVAAEATSDAFTDLLLTRLAGLNGEGTPPGDRDHHRARLLHEVAERLTAQGKRLVLLVDGLDEDLSGAGAPSIACLLPRHLPEGLKVIVASRPHPELPDDVTADHPLRTTAPVMLTPSPHAADLARLARTELRSVLREPGWKRDVVGFVAAGGGGMTVDDFEELTGTPRDLIADVLDGVVGRTLRPAEDRTYSFAHETLMSEALTRLGKRQLGAYRELIGVWASTYRHDGWPEETPNFLFGPFFSMLQRAGDTMAMGALARDAARHERMLDRTGGDGGAITEILSAQRELAAAEVPDLCAWALLDVHLGQLAERNRNLPFTLPALWATLGEHDRATAMLGKVEVSPLSWSALAVAHGRNGDAERASALIATLRALHPDLEPRTAAEVLEQLATAATMIDDDALTQEIFGDLETLAATSATGAISLMRSLGRLGRFTEAAVVVSTFDVVDDREALLELAEMAFDAGDPPTAVGLIGRARSIDAGPRSRMTMLETALRAMEDSAGKLPPPEHSDYLETIYHLARASLATDDRIRFDDLMKVLLPLIDAYNPNFLAHTAMDLIVRAGAHDAASRVLNALGDVGDRAAAMVELAKAYTDVGEHARAHAMALACERLCYESAETFPEPVYGIVTALLRIEDLITAERIAWESGDDETTREVISAWVKAGDIEAALRAARAADSAQLWESNLYHLIAEPSVDPRLRRRLVAEILAKVAGHENEPCHRYSTPRTVIDDAHGEIAAALCGAGRPQEAVEHARAVQDSRLRDQTLHRVGFALREQGEAASAAELFDEIIDLTYRLRHRPPAPNTASGWESPKVSRLLGLVEEGRIAEVVGEARSIDSYPERERIAIAIAETGAVDLALSFARNTDDDHCRGVVLLTLLESGAVESPESEQLLLEAMSLVGFADSTHAFATVAPDAFRRVIAELYPHPG